MAELLNSEFSVFCIPSKLRMATKRTEKSAAELYSPHSQRIWSLPLCRKTKCMLYQGERTLKVEPDAIEVPICKGTVNSVPLLIVVFTGFGAILAQAQQAVSPSPKPKINPDNPAACAPLETAGDSTPTSTQINPQELERLTKAADKVLNRIQSRRKRSLPAGQLF